MAISSFLNDKFYFLSHQDKFSRPDSDQMGQLQSQVDEVKGVMTQNIEKVMERGERLEDLIAQTNDLEAHVSRRIIDI